MSSTEADKAETEVVDSTVDASTSGASEDAVDSSFYSTCGACDEESGEADSTADMGECFVCFDESSKAPRSPCRCTDRYLHVHCQMRMALPTYLAVEAKAGE